MINLFKMLLFNHQTYQKRKFIFFKFQEESIKKLKDKQNNLHKLILSKSIYHSHCPQQMFHYT